MKIALNLESTSVVLGTPGVWDYTISGGTAALRAQKSKEISQVVDDIPSPPDNYSWTWYTDSGPSNTLIWEIIKD